MNVLEAIAQRRAIFPVSFTDTPVTDEQIWQLLQAANFAPTHKLTEPWRFWVIRGEAKERFSDRLLEAYQAITPPAEVSEMKLKKMQQNPRLAQAVIAIGMRRDPKASIPEWEELAATAMAVQNLWLAATELGLGGYWGSPPMREHALVRDFLQLADDETCWGFFYLGHYQPIEQTAKRQPIEQKVRWITD